MEKRKLLQWSVDGFVLVLLIACLWVPDIQKVLGRVWVWEQFRNWDTFIMLPGWAYTQGAGLNTDIVSSWGMGAVIFISRCAQVLGGFDLSHVFIVLMGMVIIYYGVFYFFLRAWLRSVLLAVIILGLAVKIQMFHSGTSPLIWLFPQDTPVRHWLDIPVLFCLWRHACRFHRKHLMWAAVLCGAALAWAPSTGLCLLAAFWGYLIFLLMVAEYRPLLVSNYKDVRGTFFCGLMPLAVMGLILFLLQGSVVFNMQFWKNTFEPEQLFLHGAGVLSFYTCLYDRHFFAFIAGFAIPVIYAWTLLIIAGRSFAKKIPREDLFLVPLCVYGLAMYAHYLAHAATSHYYAVGIPVVMVIGFWLSNIMQGCDPAWGRKILFWLAIGTWGALFTNIFFIYYPNIFDISRMDWKPEISVYRSQFHFDQDAGMIQRLTPPNQKAALISSFEAQILMQAKRAPFFYYAPFPGTSLLTQERLNKTLSQIAEISPEYIFVEKRLLGKWPAEYVRYYPGIIMVLRYVAEHYHPQEEGAFLIAMRRK